MAAHQNVIVPLELEVKGTPLSFTPGGHRVLEAGTVGFVGKRSMAPYIEGARVYEFYPAGWSDTPAAAINDTEELLKIAVVAETVVLPLFGPITGGEEPVVSVPIFEAGYARLRHVGVEPQIPCLGTRCKLRYSPSQNIFMLNLIEDASLRSTYVGRIISATKTGPAYAGPEVDVGDVEFFRQRPYKILAGR